MTNTKSTLLADAILILFVFLYGLNQGPMMFESFTSDLTWASHPPESFHMFLGDYGHETAHWWKVVTPLTTLVGVLTLLLNWRAPSRRKQLLLGFGLFMTINAATIAYFVPEQVGLTENAGALLAEVLKARADRWVFLNAFRNVAAAAGFLSLLLAVRGREQARARSAPAYADTVAMPAIDLQVR